MRGGVTPLYKLYELQKLRASIGVPNRAVLLLSVGELNANKNHEVVIRALAKLRNPDIHYAIAGVGELHDHLLDVTKALGLSEQVHLLGYRRDVADLYRAADLYVHPSVREGLPVALMEAVASGTPVICSDIRGNSDLAPADALFRCTDSCGIAEKIQRYLDSDFADETDRNGQALTSFGLENVISQMKAIYMGCT